MTRLRSEPMEPEWSNQSDGNVLREGEGASCGMPGRAKAGAIVTPGRVTAWQPDRS